MQDYNTIIGVITMRRNECSYSVIQSRYHIGSSTLQLIMKRFGESGPSVRSTMYTRLYWGSLKT